ncbi:MAG: hypothetical protein WBD40_00690 [Tepidisphaeraceae bacterium]
MRDDSPLPLRPAEPDHVPSRPTPAPPWVALLAAWLGLLMLIAAIVFPFLPGSRNPRAELEHAQPYSFADKFLPVPMYGVTIALFLGIVVFWQMRKEPRPLPDAMVAHRVQAWVGIALALIAMVILYVYVALRGPR